MNWKKKKIKKIIIISLVKSLKIKRKKKFTVLKTKKNCRRNATAWRGSRSVFPAPDPAPGPDPDAWTSYRTNAETLHRVPDAFRPRTRGVRCFLGQRRRKRPLRRRCCVPTPRSRKSPSRWSWRRSRCRRRGGAGDAGGADPAPPNWQRPSGRPPDSRPIDRSRTTILRRNPDLPQLSSSIINIHSLIIQIYFFKNNFFFFNLNWPLPWPLINLT